ncbi:MAG: HIT family protein [Candidatus Aenigmarchaeota archaeon]|nr:HIT family protein [Candidatus Aenigmarchaeota archaeon]
MECIFCKIVDNTLPSRKIYEDDDNVAILDINPASPGHVLVIPKKHKMDIFDIEGLDLRRTIEVVKLIAEKLKKELNTPNMNIIQNNGRIAGQIVDHLHIHVVPRFPNDNIDFRIPRYEMGQDQFYEIQKKLNINSKLPDPPTPSPKTETEEKK